MDEQGRVEKTAQEWLNTDERSYSFSAGRVDSIELPGGVGKIRATTTPEHVNIAAELVNQKALDNGVSIEGGEGAVRAAIVNLQNQIGKSRQDVEHEYAAER